MASGIPGNPPPVPISMISAPSAKSKAAAILKECSTCFSYKLSISFLEMMLILLFQSLYKGSRALNWFICCSVKSVKYLRMISICSIAIRTYKRVTQRKLKRISKAGYINILLVPVDSWLFPECWRKDDIIKEHPDIKKQEHWPQVSLIELFHCFEKYKCL